MTWSGLQCLQRMSAVCPQCCACKIMSIDRCSVQSACADVQVIVLLGVCLCYCLSPSVYTCKHLFLIMVQFLQVSVSAIVCHKESVSATVCVCGDRPEFPPNGFATPPPASRSLHGLSQRPNLHKVSASKKVFVSPLRQSSPKQVRVWPQSLHRKALL